MTGLRRICRMYGGMTVKGNNGKTIKYVWDYANEEPVDEKKMTPAKRKASDIAWAKLMKEQVEAAQTTTKQDA